MCSSIGNDFEYIGRGTLASTPDLNVVDRAVGRMSQEHGCCPTPHHQRSGITEMRFQGQIHRVAIGDERLRNDGQQLGLTGKRMNSDTARPPSGYQRLRAPRTPHGDRRPSSRCMRRSLPTLR